MSLLFSRHSSFVSDFTLARIPALILGAGRRSILGEKARILLGAGGEQALLVTGSSSLERSGMLDDILGNLAAGGVGVKRVIVEGEPEANFIDARVSELKSLKDGDIGLVIGVGGGSVIDAAKAISALLPRGNSILDHLEGVGRGVPHDGEKIPFFALPTTAGTGGEATKNAVVSGELNGVGFKKSLRHDNLVADLVILDPELTMDCPAHVSAACGLDAFTQLLEPYLSPTSSPFTDQLALQGMRSIATSLSAVCRQEGKESEQPAHRQNMAYGAFLSGICLANAGLGLVHGLASPLGAMFPIPHGVICGTLFARVLKENVKAIGQAGRDIKTPDAEIKIAMIGEVLRGSSERETLKEPGMDRASLVSFALDTLSAWTEDLAIPRLGTFQVTSGDLEGIVERAANRNNPVELSREEIRAILTDRL